MYDSLLGYACDYRLAKDGEIRCLPADDTIGVISQAPALFSDPECTKQLAYSGSPVHAKTVAYASDVELYYPLFALYPTGAEVYFRDTTGCFPQGPYAPNPKSPLFVSGPGHALGDHVAAAVTLQ
jgi:hypothetical protein